MLFSIRWRLAASYLILTVLTVTLLAGLAFGLLFRQMAEQERGTLDANASALAEEALPLMTPQLQSEELAQLAFVSSFLGDFRVRILDIEGNVLVDSRPADFSNFVFLERSLENLPTAPPDIWDGRFQMDRMVPGAARLPMWFMLVDNLEDLPDGMRYMSIRRSELLRGYQLSYDTLTDETAADSPVRSTLLVSRTIGTDSHPVGLLEISGAPDFKQQALQSTLEAFLPAAIIALLLSAVLGLIMGRQVSTPIIQLADVSEKMSAADLSLRAPENRHDEIGRLASGFNQMAERLEHSFSALAEERDTLRRFISDASHELRTPITALKNYSELLTGAKKISPSRKREFMLDSHTQIERLEWITNSLLDLSRLDAGVTTLQPTDFSLLELAKSTVEGFILQAQAQGISMKIETEQDCSIHADRRYLELALSNLIDNALKFSNQGDSVQISWKQDQSSTRIEVRDNGAGIQPEDLPYIFDRFYRGKKITIPGSGLGLAVVDSVLKAHHGSVRVNSEPGKGSTFTLILPVGKLPEEETEHQEE
ncbi:MAG: HAMP domain-containing histidine kinase [Anaerolineales bacterium]|nr:HAMP domain-containing histidine kinase [Anaerolineales bacterium]